MDKTFYIGIDVGATNIKSALVDDQGHLHQEEKVKTEAIKGFENTFQTLCYLIENYIQSASQHHDTIKGIGIGCPGIINVESGIIMNLTNMPGWVNKPLAELLKDKFSIETKIDNDLNVYTLGEQYFGAGKNVKNFICTAIGTGFGGGIVINGNLFRGSSMSAGEIGHMTLISHGGPICGCGNTGCLEALGSEIAIIRRAQEQLMGGGGRKIRELMGDYPLTARTVWQAAETGDAESKTILREVGEWIGVGLATLANTLNPELIIIGGGVANAGDFILTPLKESMQKRTLPYIYNSLRIETSQLGDRAGILGASALVSDTLVAYALQ